MNKVNEANKVNIEVFAQESSKNLLGNLKTEIPPC
jgi:hypothetical protein